jgi:hypothetical protein
MKDPIRRDLDGENAAIVREHMRIYAPHCTVHSIYQ